MINYSYTNEWKKFLLDYIVPLKDSADVLMGYYNYLKSRVDGVEIDNIDEDLKKILLGGVDDEGNYLDGSLSKFYRSLFGISLNVELPKYMNLVKQRATKGVKCMIVQWKQQCSYEDPFFRFVNATASQTNKIISIAESKGIIDAILLKSPSSIDYQTLVKNPEEVLKLVENFYNKAVMITPNYNEYSLFILTIRSIIRRYLEAAYPEFKENFENLRSFFGLQTLFAPNVGDIEKKREFTILYLPEGSFGFGIIGLYWIVWIDSMLFKMFLSQYFEKTVDLIEDFAEMAKNSVILSSEILNTDKLISSTSRLHLDSNKQWVDKWIRPTRYGVLQDLLLVDIKKKPVSVIDCFNEISPFLFVGLVDIKVGDFFFEFKPIKELE